MPKEGPSGGLACFVADDDSLSHHCSQEIQDQPSQLVDCIKPSLGSAYVDNCENTHICKYKHVFVNFKVIIVHLRKKYSSIGGALRLSDIGIVK